MKKAQLFNLFVVEGDIQDCKENRNREICIYVCTIKLI